MGGYIWQRTAGEQCSRTGFYVRSNRMLDVHEWSRGRPLWDGRVPCSGAECGGWRLTS